MGSVRSQTFCNCSGNYWSRSAGLAIRIEGAPVIVLEVPAREVHGSQSRGWGELPEKLADLADLKEQMHPQALRKMLPKFPPTHPLFSEAYMALDASFRMEGEMLIRNIETYILELEDKERVLVERFDNLPPPMEALAAVPLGRSRKKKQKESV